MQVKVVVHATKKLIFMKTIRIFTHPYTLIVSFCTILISGEHIGGFYFMYILLGLTDRALHSILAIVGTVLIIISHVKLQRPVKFISNLIALAIMILSIFVFFYQDKENYNIETFYQVVPLVMMGFFFIVSIAFAINNAILLFNAYNISKNLQ